jgi:hypothetical protein
VIIICVWADERPEARDQLVYSRRPLTLKLDELCVTIHQTNKNHSHKALEAHRISDALSPWRMWMQMAWGGGGVVAALQPSPAFGYLARLEPRSS